MTINDLMRAIENAETDLNNHKDFIKSLIKPAVKIKKSNIKSMYKSSKFGGNPDLPEGFEWPKYKEQHYTFLGQINFSEMKTNIDILPKRGLLSLFVADFEDDEVFWQDDGYVKGYYFEDSVNLRSISNLNSSSKCMPIEFEEIIDIPFHEELLESWEIGEDAKDELFYDIREKLKREPDYLLGYPQYCSLAYDPTPEGNEWISLLTLDSHDELNWCWHDGDFLMIFIEKTKLLEKDFSNLKCDAG